MYFLFDQYEFNKKVWVNSGEDEKQKSTFVLCKKPKDDVPKYSTEILLFININKK